MEADDQSTERDILSCSAKILSEIVENGIGQGGSPDDITINIQDTHADDYTIGIQKKKSNRFVVTDVKEEPEFDLHSPPKCSISMTEMHAEGKSSEKSYTGKIEKKGRFTITHLDPDSPDMRSPLQKPLDFEHVEIENMPTKPPMVPTKQKSYSHLEINVGMKEDASVPRPDSVPAQMDEGYRRVDAFNIDRLVDALMAEQAKTKQILMQLADADQEDVEEEASIPKSSPARKPRRLSSASTLGPFKGKYEHVHDQFVEMERAMQQSALAQKELENRNAMLHARLEHEIRANTELRTQLELLTRYTDSLFDDDGVIPEEDIISTTISSETSCTNNAPGSINTKLQQVTHSEHGSTTGNRLAWPSNEPPSSFQPIVRSALKDTPNHPTGIKATPLDAMLFSQASNLAEKLHHDSPGAKTYPPQSGTPQGSMALSGIRMMPKQPASTPTLFPQPSPLTGGMEHRLPPYSSPSLGANFTSTNTQPPSFNLMPMANNSQRPPMIQRTGSSSSLGAPPAAVSNQGTIPTFSSSDLPLSQNAGPPRLPRGGSNTSLL